MKTTMALAACLVTLAAACGSSDGESSDTAPAEATEEAPAETEPAATEPVATEPSETVAATEPEPEPEPETTASTEPEPTTTTELAPEVNAVGLVPLPGAQLDFSAQSIDTPTLVWSLFSGSGGIIVENLGGPMPPGCHGTSFFDPATFELLEINGIDAQAYATAGEGGCDNMQQDLADGVIDGDAVKVNDEHLIQFDFGALPELPFDVSTQIVNPGGGDGVFRSADSEARLLINDLTEATHAVGASGVFDVDQNDRTLTWIDLPAPDPGPGCDTVSLCLSDRFQVDVVDPNGSPASVVTSGDNGGRFYFFGDHDTNILVSVLNTCELNNHFWVFAAANTDVAFDLTVTDTANGESRAYSNSLGQFADAITDTAAFATCP